MHYPEGERKTPSPYLTAWHHEDAKRMPGRESIALFTEIRNLPDTSLMRFLKHDLDNVLGKATVGIQSMFEGGSDMVRPIIQAADSVFPRIPVDSSTQSGQITPVRVLPYLQYDALRTLESAVASIPSYVPILPEMQAATANEPDNGPIHQAIERSQILLHSFKLLTPIFTASMRFLYSPNDADYAYLQQPKINIRELAEFFRVGWYTQGAPDRLLSGSETISLYNLLQNARKFHSGVPVRDKVPYLLLTDFDSGTFTVTNASTRGIYKNNHILKPGKKGENGNTGYGLAIARLYALLNGYDITFTSTKKSADLYKISFTMGSPSPQPSGDPAPESILFQLPPVYALRQKVPAI